MFLLAGMCAALCAYVAVGYPLLVSLLARRRGALEPEPTSSAGCTVLLVVRNEERRIARRLRNLQRQKPAGCIRQIVVVDDRSTDSTMQILLRFQQRDTRICVLSGTGSGKAAGINTGMAACKTDIAVLADARQVFEQHAVSRLMARLVDSRVGLVAGELRYTAEKRSEVPATAGLTYWRIERKLRGAEGALGFLPCVSGAIYAVRTECMPSMPENVILDDIYAPLLVARAGWRVVYAPDAVAWDIEVAPGHEFRRRVRTLAGNFQLIRLLPWSLCFWRSGSRWAFVSHKALRLILPVIGLSGVLALLTAVSGNAVITLLATSTVAALGLLLNRLRIRGPIGTLAATISGVLIFVLATAMAAWSVMRRQEGMLWRGRN